MGTNYTRPDGTTGYTSADPEMWARSQAGAAAHHQAAIRHRQIRQGMNYAAGPSGVRLPGGMTWNDRTGAIMGQPGVYLQDLYPSVMPTRPVGAEEIDQMGQRDWDYLWGPGDQRTMDEGFPQWQVPAGMTTPPAYVYGQYGYQSPRRWWNHWGPIVPPEKPPTLGGY